MALEAEIIKLFNGERTFETGSLKALVDEMAGGGSAAVDLSTTPDKTFQISTADDTRMWKLFSISGIWSMWHMSSLALAANIDTTDALVPGAFTALELPVNSFIFAQTATGGSPAMGTFIVRSVVGSPTLTSINLSNISSLGLADTD